MLEKEYGVLKGPYDQRSSKRRVEALFLDNVGKVITRDQIIQVCGINKKTGAAYENWHQRLSELRTDEGYTILSLRDTSLLGVSEYMLPYITKREKVNKRVTPTSRAWNLILERANYCCEWNEGGQICNLKNGDKDPIGGGTVKLTADHMTPHSVGDLVDPNNIDEWQVLCGRHQVIKKNYWDSTTGKLNIEAIIQAASREDKKRAYDLLNSYFQEN